MQSVDKEQRKSRPHLRLLLVCAATAVLAVSLGLYAYLRGQGGEPLPNRVITGGILLEKTQEEVQWVRAAPRDGQVWQLERGADGMVMADDPEAALDAYCVSEVLDAVGPVTYNDVLAESAEELREHWADFGLDNPTSVVEIGYEDGACLTLRIGAINRAETPFYYMTVDGDPRLYALDTASAEALYQDRQLLYEVVQPTIHGARLDSIRLLREGEALAWQLEGSVKAVDAIDHWTLTAPFSYRADGDSMTTLMKNLENLRLGAYVCEATPEALATYGFDAPRLEVELHMAEASLGTVGAEGVYDVTEYPESTLRLVVGSAKSDMVDYALYEGRIYLVSHFIVSPLMTMSAASTLTRYPVLTALGNLHALTIATGEAEARYEITRTEQVAPNNDLVLDENGQVVYDVSVTKNGAPLRYEAFEQAYQGLLLVRVSGTLEDGWQAQKEPHTVYTFEDVSGETHTVALSDYDAMHDAVEVDGHALFYLVKGAMKLEMEE